MKNKNQNKKPQTLSSFFRRLSDKGNPELVDLLLSTQKEWYDAKHPKASIDEVRLVNSLPIDSCPRCGSKDFIRYGFRKDGIQVYKCLECERKFNPLTGTLFDSHKIPISEWVEFLIHLFQFQSTKVASIDNRNAYSTGIYWKRKVFRVLEGYQDDIIMNDTFIIDETYYSLLERDSEKKDGKLYRGLSRNQICIVTMVDKKKAFLMPCGFGKPSAKRLRQAVSSHIRDKSTMFDDGENAHEFLVKEKEVKRMTYTTKETKVMKPEENPLQPINELHKYFRRFMRSHGGYDRDDIQDYCNLFAFIYNHNADPAKMVLDFLKRDLKVKEIIRYRSKKDKKSK